MPRPPRRRWSVVMVSFILISGVACSAVQSRFTTAPSTGVAGAPAATGLPAPAARPAAAARQSVSGQSAATAQDQSAPADASVPSLDRMVIRTAQLTVEVPGDMEHAIASVRQIAQQGGGFVSNSNTHVEHIDNQDRTVADMTIQVRSDVADEAISQLRALGNVTTETTGSQDVTDEFVDVDANIRNLQASESAIVSLMNKATRIEDVLSLQRELTNVRGQIERLQGRKNYLQHRTDMATISISLRPPQNANQQTSSSAAWNPIAIAQRGWQASLSVLRGAAEVVIEVAAFSWWLIPFAAAGVYVWHRRRTSTRAAATPPAAVQ